MNHFIRAISGLRRNFNNLRGLAVTLSFGGPTLRSASTASRAAIMRTALKTLGSWKMWKVKMLECAQIHLPIKLWSAGLVSPEFWDSSPFAFNLCDASRGFPGDSKWFAPASAALHELASKLGSTNRPSRPLSQIGYGQSEFSGSRVPVQKVLYKHMLVGVHPNSLIKLIGLRVAKMTKHSHENLIGSDLESKVALSANHLKKLRMHDAFQVLRTWLNAWTTSTRYHEAVTLPCLFGCVEEVDDQAHYCRCPRMQAIIDHHVKFFRPPTALDRLGLISPSKDVLLAVAC